MLRSLLLAPARILYGLWGLLAVIVVGVAALLISYPYWWTQAGAMTDTVTHLVLALPRVSDGLHRLMLYAVDGVALGGWQLVDLALMALIGEKIRKRAFPVAGGGRRAEQSTAESRRAGAVIGRDRSAADPAAAVVPAGGCGGTCGVNCYRNFMASCDNVVAYW